MRLNTSWGYSAMHMACISENIFMVEMLLKHLSLSGDIVNCSANKVGLTPLQLAPENNEGDALRMLLLEDPRLDVNQSMDAKGTSPLLWLYAKRNDPDIGEKAERVMAMLLNTRDDIDINAVDGAGNNLLQLAIRANDVDTVKCVLVRFTVDLSHQNRQGQTVLHMAIYKSPAIKVALFEKGGVEDLEDVNGNTAGTLAEMMGDDQLCDAIDLHDNSSKITYGR